MGKADLHIHSTYSDGAPTIPAILDYVTTQTALNVIAITDHDTVAGALQARTLIAEIDTPLEVIVGSEISSQEGHIVALFIEEAIPAGLSATKTIAAIHEQGGLAFAAHPFFNDRPWRNRRKMDSMGRLAASLPLDAIEVDNSTPFLEWANRRAKYFARQHRLTAVGASDAHILPAIGKSYTTFPGTTATALYTALQQGTCRAGCEQYTVPDLLAYLRFWLGYADHRSAPPVKRWAAHPATGK